MTVRIRFFARFRELLGTDIVSRLRKAPCCPTW